VEGGEQGSFGKASETGTLLKAIETSYGGGEFTKVRDYPPLQGKTMAQTSL